MIEINLHPHGAKARRRRTKLKLPSLGGRGLSGGRLSGGGGRGGGRDPWTMAAVGVPLLALLVVGAMWYTQRAEARGLEDQVQDAIGDSTRLADLRQLSDSLTRRDQIIQERVGHVANLDGDRFVWPHLLDEMGRSLPDYTWITAIESLSPLPDLRLRIRGMAANPVAITAFIRNLAGSLYVGDVQLAGSQQVQLERFDVQSFELAVTYSEPPDSVVRMVPIVQR
ncbi:MAG: PilN domain-containing protein [Gemmatimonadota bacterium]